ncbi:hypothetical protein DXG03_004597 [Asterophora parasitica]|uniref:AB hydrolase-1 domain-containing protein n=1 Tax=Asterophora parasitica TaxID=117018 RepID=A0A9P7GAX3_9AGAR|nr:hypothetical protein DXG03_004597 [Asterophora parasitica]
MTSTATVNCKRVNVDRVSVFYREAGSGKPNTILLLHGFPSSSFQYRNLIPKLAETHHVISSSFKAPDFPGFGFTDVPDDANYEYTFENLSQTIIAFTRILKLDKFAVYMFDYGAPVGLRLDDSRLAFARPDAITALISQNGNAFEAGLSPTFWDGIRKYWGDPSAENLAPVEALTKMEATKFQYTHGEAHPEIIPPETYHLDQALLDRPGNAEIQCKLFFDCTPLPSPSF